MRLKIPLVALFIPAISLCQPASGRPAQPDSILLPVLNTSPARATASENEITMLLDRAILSEKMKFERSDNALLKTLAAGVETDKRDDSWLRRHKWKVIGCAVIAGGAGAYWWWSHRDKKGSVVIRMQLP